MKQYQLINNIAGWLVFGVAAFVYCSTIEPTASWWDCGEYISASYKLMVGHEPGAPMFQMIARLFSLLAGGDVTQVARWINTMSALASAFTILFLFWSITAFARKIVFKNGEITMPGIIAVIGSGAVGALAYTFSDSFWFSAVEGEVYAMSSFFTAIVFWAILKWESVADKPHADRWIILIALLMGMSIGVHLLNLLAIPALVVVYYFKKYDFSWPGFIASLAVSLLILVGVQYGVIPGVVWLASQFELVFVNSFGLPFNTGVVFYFILLVAAIVFGIWHTQKNQMRAANTIILSLTFLLIGYSAYFQSVIRSNANPPMDESNPDNVFALISYLNREQYGDRPLFKGHYFTAGRPSLSKEKGAKVYHKGKEKYEVVEEKPILTYDPKNSGFFPRMYSSESHHVREYKNWSGTSGKKKPSFSQNITFFVKYQLGHMYFRYFMWNFAGRQNDVQGNGAEGTGKSELLNGNWLSGIPFIDEARLGPQDNLPDSITENKAYNRFYMTPFLLGLIGLVWHFMKDKKDFFVVFLLFILTGVAIVIYLNQYPYQPRERDYAYVGSFYAFAFWIGLSVAAIFDWTSKKIPAIGSAGLATLLCLSAPYLMAKDGWDDHDRSNRTAARDLAGDYLKTCAPNAIIFTNGDNDTFPLWYAQEVEGIRTDVRVVNLSLFNTNWYIDQLRRKAYESDPLPFSIGEEKLLGDNRLQIPLVPNDNADYVDLKTAIDFVAHDEAKFKMQGYNYIPSTKFRLPVDSAKVIANGTVLPGQEKNIVKAVEWEVKARGGMITRNHLMMLDILANNNWERPIYFAVTVGDELYLNLQDYFQVEGFAYRLVPIKNIPDPRERQTGSIATGRMYEKMVNEFAWGNIKDPNVYQGTETMRMSINYRMMFARLANALFEEGKKAEAVKALDKCMEELPSSSIGVNVSSLSIMDAYYRLGEIEKANKIAEELGDTYNREMDYFLNLPQQFVARTGNEPGLAFYIINNLAKVTENYKQEELNKRFVDMLKDKVERTCSNPYLRKELELDRQKFCNF